MENRPSSYLTGGLTQCDAGSKVSVCTGSAGAPVDSEAAAAAGVDADADAVVGSGAGVFSFDWAAVGAADSVAPAFELLALVVSSGTCAGAEEVCGGPLVGG